jgi:hypothetical protein
MFEKMETLNKKEGLMKMKKFNIPTVNPGTRVYEPDLVYAGNVRGMDGQ